MEPSGFDYVARQISVYGDLLLTVPAWVKEQAFDIHIAAGQPVSISGREGILFLKRGGVSQMPQEGVATTAAQVRELFLQACGYSVFRHQEEIRPAAGHQPRLPHPGRFHPPQPGAGAPAGH